MRKIRCKPRNAVCHSVIYAQNLKNIYCKYRILLLRWIVQLKTYKRTSVWRSTCPTNWCSPWWWHPPPTRSSSIPANSATTTTTARVSTWRPGIKRKRIIPFVYDRFIIFRFRKLNCHVQGIKHILEFLLIFKVCLCVVQEAFLGLRQIKSLLG